jgi:hypothetical protein
VRAHLDLETTICVVAKRDPARISLRIGSVYVTGTVDEALALANDLADAVAELRNARTYRDRRRTP